MLNLTHIENQIARDISTSRMRDRILARPDPAAAMQQYYTSLMRPHDSLDAIAALLLPELNWLRIVVLLEAARAPSEKQAA